MTPQIAASEFRLVIAMSDLVDWPACDDEPKSNHARLQAVFDALGAPVSIVPLVAAYFNDTARAGRGDVHVFDFDPGGIDILAIDTFNEPTDQLDLIELFIRCADQKTPRVSEFIWKYFNGCAVQIYASQQTVCSRLRDVLDNNQFPRPVGGGGFLQRQVRHSAVQPFTPADGCAGH
jgi:hypothetical protein